MPTTRPKARSWRPEAWRGAAFPLASVTLAVAAVAQYARFSPWQASALKLEQIDVACDDAVTASTVTPAPPDPPTVTP